MRNGAIECIAKRIVLAAFVAAAVVCGGSKHPQTVPNALQVGAIALNRPNEGDAARSVREPYQRDSGRARSHPSSDFASQSSLRSGDMNAPQNETAADMARGWRLVEEVTEEVSYAMPENGVEVGNWGKRGTFGEWLRYELGWGFPLGSNEAAYSSFSVFNDAKIRPTPRDRSHEICAVGVPMLAMQESSRFWVADGSGGETTLTWENFFLNADTNTPINAQIVLCESGDFVTRSNEVARYYTRIDPHDWDGDGLANEIDAEPYTNDGDCFGTGEGWWAANAAAVAATNANPEAYYWLEFAATKDKTRVAVTCDGASDLGDMVVIARTNRVCRVPLLVGATYAVRASAPLTGIVTSDDNAEVTFNDDVRGNAAIRRVEGSAPHRAVAWGRASADFNIDYPLEFFFNRYEDGYRLGVLPVDPGAALVSVWGGCCSQGIVTNGFAWTCAAMCACGGTAQTLEGVAAWEGCSRGFSCTALCGCGHDAPPPEPVDSESSAASVSASFSTDAIIFEDAYENTPGVWVGRRSSAATLTIHANGGPNGGTLTATATNLGKLQKNSGPAFPAAAVEVPAGHSVSYEMNYVGLEASDALEDIVVTATFEENGSTNAPLVSVAKLTAVRIELQALHTPLANPCQHRHVFGVDEKVNTNVFPPSAVITWRDKVDVDVSLDGASFYCPWLGGNYSPCVECGDASYNTEITTIEPRVVCKGVEWSGIVGTNGVAGNVMMRLHMYIEPEHVSFEDLYMEEIPDNVERGHGGYFDDPQKGGAWSHTKAAGAGVWEPVQASGYWTTDHPEIRSYPRPWSNGWKEWHIPVGWGISGLLKGQIQPDPTTQRFELTETGTVTITKYRHTIKRDTKNRVWLDGVRKN